MFTCLTTRAIHLEVLRSLEALTRFSSCRGRPGKLRSDNGTDMIGALRELHEIQLRCNQNNEAHRESQAAKLKWTHSNKIKGEMKARRIQWELNPPAAPHMGGVWERQIQMIKKYS